MPPINLKGKLAWFKIHNFNYFLFAKMEMPAKQNGRTWSKHQSNITAFRIQYSLTLELSINTLWHSNFLFPIKLRVRRGLAERWGWKGQEVHWEESLWSWMISQTQSSVLQSSERTVKYSANTYSLHVNIDALSNYFHTVSCWMARHSNESLCNPE